MVVEIDAALVEEASELDRSPLLNRSNIRFSRLSMKIARRLLSSASLSPSDVKQELEQKLAELATQWNGGDGGGGGGSSRPPFCCVEGVAYALNAEKMRRIRSGPGHVAITVPFYRELERGRPFDAAANPNGEEAPVQKLEEALFLLEFNDRVSMDLVFVNDAIAEKKDDGEDGGSAGLFQKAILEHATNQGWKFHLQKPPATDAAAEKDRHNFDCLTLLEGRLRVKFTSCEIEASRGNRYETASERRRRFENRDDGGKLRERKGGAVLAGMEMDPPAPFADHPRRVLRCLVDGDSAHPVASFVGDAAYSILERGSAAYLGNLRHPFTCVSTAVGEGGGDSAGILARRVQNRKLFFSGLVVPFLFPELALKYRYTGTTQLPIKAFRGDINFQKAKLKTVQPNVDLGMLALLCSHLNNNGNAAQESGGGDVGGDSIDSGPVTIRDNVASSTMTTDDLSSEWTKTYGPIFTSAVSLCRELKPEEFQRLPVWLTTFIDNMELEHYTTLFGEEAASNADVVALFSTMKKFKGSSEADREAVLDELKTSFDKIFVV